MEITYLELISYHKSDQRPLIIKNKSLQFIRTFEGHNIIQTEGTFHFFMIQIFE